MTSWRNLKLTDDGHRVVAGLYTIAHGPFRLELDLAPVWTRERFFRAGKADALIADGYLTRTMGNRRVPQATFPTVAFVEKYADAQFAAYELTQLGEAA